jgi:hypothetical protein
MSTATLVELSFAGLKLREPIPLGRRFCALPKVFRLRGWVTSQKHGRGIVVEKTAMLRRVVFDKVAYWYPLNADTAKELRRERLRQKIRSEEKGRQFFCQSAESNRLAKIPLEVATFPPVADDVLQRAVDFCGDYGFSAGYVTSRFPSLPESLTEHVQPTARGEKFCSRCRFTHIPPLDWKCEFFRLMAEFGKAVADGCDLAVLKAKAQGKRGRPPKFASDAARQRADYALRRSNKINNLGFNGQYPVGRGSQISLVGADDKTCDKVLRNLGLGTHRGEFLTDAPKGKGAFLQLDTRDDGKSWLGVGQTQGVEHDKD